VRFGTGFGIVGGGFDDPEGRAVPRYGAGCVVEIPVVAELGLEEAAGALSTSILVDFTSGIAETSSAFLFEPTTALFGVRTVRFERTRVAAWAVVDCLEASDDPGAEI